MTFPYLSKAVARKPLRVCVCQKLGADAAALFRLAGWWISALGMRLSHKYCLICPTESTCLVKNSMNIVGKTFKFREACSTQITGQTGSIGVWLFTLSVFFPGRSEDGAEMEGRQCQEPPFPPQLSPVYDILSHQTAFFMLIELTEQPCVQRQCECLSLRMPTCVCVCVHLHVRTIASNVFTQARYCIHRAYTLTIIRTLWKTYS